MRARRPAHPAISRLRRADLYCKPNAPGDGVTVAEQSHTVTATVRWVRGPSGPLPPKAARNAPANGRHRLRGWVGIDSCAPLRGGALDAGQKARAPSDKPSPSRGSLLQAQRPRRRRDGCRTESHRHRNRALGARAFWPAAAEGGRKHEPANGRHRLRGWVGIDSCAPLRGGALDAGQKARAPSDKPSPSRGSLLQAQRPR